MENMNKQERVDELIQQFWKNGYLTVSRKYGTYLPDPPRMGKYDIDALGKFKNQYAIGVTLTAEEIDAPGIENKLIYLATRHTKYTNKNVLLFVAIPQGYASKVNKIVASLNNEIKKNIKISAIPLSTIN
jgi:hypothetical protein